MTALRDWSVDDPRRTDAELVHGSMAGDRAAFAEIYDRYADRLHDFCVGMLREFDAAADCVQETFCLAATRLPQLRDPDRLRPWLYSIARNEALRRLRDRRREAPSEELPDVVSGDDSPEILSARAELADLVAEVSGGLSDRDRAVLDLAFRHGLEGPDLADALGVSQGNANTMVHRLRQTVERSLGALLVSRQARSVPDACPQLREIIDGWDGEFTVLMRKRIARHIESCEVCDEERRRMVSPSALLATAPAFIPAPAWLREQTLNDIQLVSHNTAMDAAAATDTSGDAAGAVSVDNTGRDRKRMLLAAVFVALLAAATALLLAWLNTLPTPLPQTDQMPTAPRSAPPSPPPAPPPPPATPRSATPPPAPPPPVQTTVVAPAPTLIPSTPSIVEEPAAKPSVPRPSLKPPMSFTPTVVVPTQEPARGGNGSQPRAGTAPPGGGGP